MASKKKTENTNIGDIEFYILFGLTVFIFIIIAWSLNPQDSLVQIPIFYTIAYLFFLFISLFFISGNQLICGKYDVNLAWTSGVFPFSFVFLLGVLLLETFPGWLRGFANTIGVIIIGYLGYDKHIKENIIKKNSDNNNLKYFYNDPIPLFNELTLDSYEIENDSVKWTQLLGETSIFKNVIKDPQSDNDLVTLANHIKNKNLISYMIWYMLLGTITLFMSINNMINDNRCSITSRDQAEFIKAFSKEIK